MFVPDGKVSNATARTAQMSNLTKQQQLDIALKQNLVNFNSAAAMAKTSSLQLSSQHVSAPNGVMQSKFKSNDML